MLRTLWLTKAAFTDQRKALLRVSRRETVAWLARVALAGGITMRQTDDAPVQAAPEPAQPFLHLPVGGTVLFQGDSITDGGRWRDGMDYNHIMGQDYAYVVAGRYGADFTEWNLKFVNRGISGNTVTDLLARWQPDTLALQPDLLSILVGVNDAMAAVHGRPNAPSTAQYAQDYEQLIQKTLAALPSVRLVLCQPFVLPVGQTAANYAQWRTEVDKRGASLTELARKYKTCLVPFQRAFDDACQRAPAEHWSWDGIHPTYAGHYLMARTWMRTVTEFSLTAKR